MTIPRTRFAVLLFTDIVRSTELKARHGVPEYLAALKVHNDHFEALAKDSQIRILQNMGDGYFAEAGSVAEAVRFALRFQHAMRAGPWHHINLTTRVGINAGEVATMETQGGSGLVAPGADLAARVMSLAIGGQILLTRWPFDEARHFVREHPETPDRSKPGLQWQAHGPYLLKGCDETVEIFEVGAEGMAPLTPPPNSEKAKRAVRPGEEETLGWRPALGLEVPLRPGWRLVERLGAGGFGEVWAGEHSKLKEKRAFKFCFDGERLRALKREVTLVKLLRLALGDRDDIVRYYELKLDEPPFYLESELAPHGNLLQWAEKQGGLAVVPLQQRLELVAHTASALAAAHSIGVLHKDIKPANILIFDGPDGSARPRLVDFGIGTLAEKTALAQYNVTPAGFTRETLEHTTGTPTYSPPEYVAGKPYTIQGDIYGLGVVLYQVLVGDGRRPLAQGWERDVNDPLLREDVAACVEGDPKRRIASATEVARRLLNLKLRHAEILEKDRLSREAAEHERAEASAVAAHLRAARLRKVAATFAGLAILALAAGFIAWRKNAAYQTMLQEAARSDRFVAEQKLRNGDEQAAFAHLARAALYDPSSSLHAEMAIAGLNRWQHPPPTSILNASGLILSRARFSPDSKLVLTACSDGTAELWHAVSGKLLRTFSGHTRGITSARFSPDASLVLTGSDDKTARLWKVADGNPIFVLTEHSDSVMDAIFSPDGTRILTVSLDKTALIWDATYGKVLLRLTGHRDPIHAGQFSPNGAQIVTGSWDKTARIWDAIDGKLLTTLEGHNESVLSVQYNSQGTKIITGACDQGVRVWNAKDGNLLIVLQGDAKGAVRAEFSPDGTRIAVASTNGVVSIWDALTGKITASLRGHMEAVQEATFSPDGSRALSASIDGTARLWDITTSELVGIFKRTDGRIGNAQFSPDGTYILHSSGQTVKVYNSRFHGLRTLVNGKQNYEPEEVFSPDGKQIITATGNRATLWHTLANKPGASFQHPSTVLDARFRMGLSGIIS